MPNLDDIDKSIVNRIQSEFPITSRPYLAVADELGLTEKEVLDRVARLKKNGIFRRIGGNFVPGKLGFVSTLCAARVPADKIENFASIVNRYPGVWFTFISPSMDEIEANLKKIAEDSGVSDILNLPATKVFKINAQFDV